MAVEKRDRALDALQLLLGTETVPVERVLRHPYLPDGMEPADKPVRLTPADLIGGYGSDARYELDTDPTTALLIAGPAADVLTAATSTSDDDARAYLESSLDLTMQGGTTSGVVYPLAICEMATSFRFRNVGGASAGAIAAALTAAAELGRSEGVRNPGVPAPPLGQLRPGAPQVRRGFTGLTDIIGWLTQVGPSDPTDEEFRLAQLFRPGRDTRRVFRVLVAIMRRRLWTLPLALLTAFAPMITAAGIAAIIGTAILTGIVDGRLTGSDRPWYGVVAVGLVGLAAFVATVAIPALLIPALASRLGRLPRPIRSLPSWVRQLRTVSSEDAPPVPFARSVVWAVLLSLSVIAYAVARPVGYATALLVGLAGSLIVLLILVGGAGWYLFRFGELSFGLVAGTTDARRRRSLVDVLAGMPRSTITDSVVPWLDNALSRLAGLPEGEVLRFGHLWAGANFHQRRTDPTSLTRWQAMAEDKNQRLVNLELMTTDLSRQRPYRFPLPSIDSAAQPEQLFVCLDQLRNSDAATFPEPVLKILGEGDGIAVHDASGHEFTVHPLPQPWDLPVIVAVRISMSMPALFRAVPLYRLVQRTAVEDDFGRKVLDQGARLEWPVDGDTVAELLWLADGGITSNFPVHFFDSPLPRWPTVSLNLGQHPDLAPHQDVWLPQDWDEVPIPVRSVRNSGASFAAAILTTARSWRDSMQSAMPGYRNRIAQVRVHRGEGGTNVFMRRDVIASMALRGALAGARLRTRYADETHWNRFRWLRLRVAMNNIEGLRQTVQERQCFYADAFSGPEWLQTQQQTFVDTPVGEASLGGPLPWYVPAEEFWPAAPQLLEAYVEGYTEPADPASNVFTTEVPEPEPLLRQTPVE